MMKSVLLIGALLGGAPLLSQDQISPEPAVVDGRFVWFRLSETKEEVARILGLPHLSADFGADFHSWQYRDPEADHDDFSRSLVFRRSTGRLIAVTRSYVEPVAIDRLFPEPSTRLYCDTRGFCALVRDLGDSRLLIAPGVSKRPGRAGELLLIQRDKLPAFLPWLAARMAGEQPNPPL